MEDVPQEICFLRECCGKEDTQSMFFLYGEDYGEETTKVIRSLEEDKN